MAAPPNTGEALPPLGDEGAKDGFEVCLFDESPDEFSRTVRAISELTAGEPELDVPEAEIQRVASSITFLREWRHFTYHPKGVSFTDDTESASSRNGMHNITLPQFSSASVPQITQHEDQEDNAVSFDFVLFAGGNVWALDWCPRLSDKPGSSINCEHLAVSAHPPGSSYHKLGMPLTGRGIIQVWCLLAPFEDDHPCKLIDAPKPRGRPRKIPDGTNSVGSSSNPPKPRGRPRKIPDGNNSVSSPSNPPKPRGRPRKRPIDLSEPVAKRPRGRPRKYPLPVAVVEDSSLISRSQDIVLFDPLSASTVIPDDLPLAYVMPTANSVKSVAGKGRGQENLTDKVTCSSSTTLTEDVCTMSSPITTTCMEPKRTRGRPRKYPVPSKIRSISATETRSGKDTTCQPVDHTACTGSDANLSINAADAAFTVTSSNAACENISKGENLSASRSDNMANETALIGLDNGIVGCKVVEVNENNTGNDTSHCNTENAQVNQVAPICKNNGIDGMKAAEPLLIEESREHDKKFSSIENLNSSPIPKDIALPRVVLCLAHNGKVAWDIKWKPLIPNQPEHESCLGFLAVLLGNGSLEVWEVPSPRMIQKIYSPSMVEGSDPRFLKLQPVFRCAKVTCGNRQSIPLTVDWSPSPPHDLILAGCHDGTVALWKFSMNFSSQDSKPFMCVTADSVPIRALSWAPYISDENINTFVTAGEDGLKFWDLRDPYRPLWELTTAPRAVLSLHWLKDSRGIVISLEDGTLKFLSLPRIANDVPVTGRPFIGTKTQGVSTYQLSEYLIWSVHASEITGYAAYCGADGTAVHFQLTSRFWEKEPGRNRAPYFLCGSLSEDGENIKIGSNSRKSPLLNVPLGAKKGTKSCQDVVQVQDVEKDKPQNITDSGGFIALAASCENPELGDGQEDGHGEEQGAGAIVLAGPGPTGQENDGICNNKASESPKDFEVFPPKSVALHRVRWNTNKGSERWLCYGGAAGIIRCQRF